MPVRTVGRITRRAAFAELQRSRARGTSGPVRVSFVPAEDEDGGVFTQVAYAIGRNCGGAVVRNSLRRRTRAGADEYGRRRRNERFHVAHGHVKRRHGLADRRELLDRRFLRTSEKSRRKNGNMGIGVGVCRMEVAAHFLYKNARGTADIGNGRVHKARHEV